MADAESALGVGYVRIVMTAGLGPGVDLRVLFASARD
jgi:hypothetical protein